MAQPRALVVFLLMIVGTVARGQLPAAPPTEKHPVVDRYFDVAVTDDYRWLEEGAAPAVRAWSDAQNQRARRYLDGLPSVAPLRKRVGAIEGATSADYLQLVERQGRFFALKRQPPLQQPLLVMLGSTADTKSEKVIVDPNKLDAGGAISIDFFVPSLDGQWIAASLSRGGSEAGDLHLIHVADGADTATIPRVNFATAGGSVAWATGGFYYTRYPRSGERPAADLDFYQQIWFHPLDGKPDRYVLGQEFPRVAEIALRSTRDGKWTLATVANGDGGEFALYLSGDGGAWKPITKFSDQVVEGQLGDDGALYLLSRKGAPRGQLLRLPFTDGELAHAKILVREGDASIESLAVTRGGLFLLEVAGGPSEIRAYDLKGAPRGLIPLPPISSVADLARAGDDDLLLRVESYTEPPAWHLYRGGGAGLAKTALARTAPVDFSDVEVVRDVATSKDGTKVPLTILRKKGAKLDGSNPALLTGYGGFNLSYAPRFTARYHILLEQGMAVAVANLRGGSEFGATWHEAGYLTHKQNVFDDFLACARRLVELGYAKADRLAIEGGSNGGLLVGAALVQAPALFRAVVAHVGLYDMLRSERSPNGTFNIAEYGTVADRAQFAALHAYSPYHHVSDGTAYPAALFLTGVNDARVDPMHSRKMVARLQAATGGKGTILLRTTDKAGHGHGTSLSERIAETVDVYAFLFQQLGITVR